MIRRRWLPAAVLTLLLWVPLGIRAGGMLWEVSPAYRNLCAARLSDSLGLPSEIGRVRRAPGGGWEFSDVRVWLPQRRGVALLSNHALLSPADERSGTWNLRLIQAAAEISHRTWLHPDFRDILESGLRAGVSGGIREVRFERSRIELLLGGLRIELPEAVGKVEFNADAAFAHAVCARVNDLQLSEPAVLSIELAPTDDSVEIRHAQLTLSGAPLAALGLEAILGAPVSTGSFGGRLTYDERGARRVLLDGSAGDIDLAEWTRFGGRSGWAGRCAELRVRIALEDEQFADGSVAGRLRDVSLSDVGRGLDIPGLSGVATLDLAEVSATAARLERLTASGAARDVSLLELTRALGLGEMSGRLAARIDDLTVVDERIVSADLTLEIVGDEAGGRWIEGRLLSELANRAMGVQLPPMLPERITYERLAARLEVRDERLYVHGVQVEGIPADDVILSVRIFGQVVPVVRAPSEPIDLRPLLAPLRERLAALREAS